jgi:hypothetical protein
MTTLDFVQNSILDVSLYNLNTLNPDSQVSLEIQIIQI